MDIQSHKKWKFGDSKCVGCGEREETGDEILSCLSFGDASELTEKMAYSWFYGDSVKNMVKVANVLKKRLKAREKILEVVI